MKKFMLIALLFLSAIAHASGDSCNALLNIGIYNTTMAASAVDANAMALSTFCSADYDKSDSSSSQAGQIRASYGLISGGTSATVRKEEIVTKQSQLCTSGFNSSAYSNKASGYSKVIYQGALDAWNKCQQLANQGLVFSIQPSSTMQGVTVSISAPTGFAATYYGVTQYGAGTSTCTTMANGSVLQPSSTRPFKFSSESRVTVTCKRDMVRHDSYLSADAQDLVFVTSADSLTVPLSAIGSYSRVTADKIKADAIAAANDDAKNMISAASSEINSALNRLGNNIRNELGRKLDGSDGAKCRNINTPPNDEGSGKLIFLDRHTLQCSDDEYLTLFHLHRTDDKNFQLQGRCCKVWR